MKPIATQTHTHFIKTHAQSHTHTHLSAPPTGSYSRVHTKVGSIANEICTSYMYNIHVHVHVHTACIMHPDIRPVLLTN